MIDIADLAVLAMLVTADHGRLAVIVIAVFNLNRIVWIFAQVGPGEAVTRIGRIGELDKPVRVIAQPGRFDPGMVGDHVTGQIDAALPTAGLEVVEGPLPSQVIGDNIFINSIG